MYTLAHIWSGVRSRLLDPSSADPSAITLEANAALMELHGKIRQSREDWLDTIQETDVFADRDTYQYPDAVDTLKVIERLDMGGEIFPSQRMSYHERYARTAILASKLVTSDTVIVLPDRKIQLQPIPTADMRNGLRWTFIPKIVELANATDSVAGIPDKFFEWLIIGTIDRIRQFNNVALANPEAYEQFRRKQMVRLTQELRPKELMTPNHIIDEDEFYGYV